ncbi:MAG: hypothetical protein AAF842_06520 [Planctomycetota bacterium]
MFKPPPDVDRDRFVIGKGVYGQWRTAGLYRDTRVVRIDPKPPPYTYLVLFTLVLASIFAGFCWLITRLEELVEIWSWFYPLILTLGTASTITPPIIILLVHRVAMRHGTWFVYDRMTRRVTLPRSGETFDANEIVHLEYITTKRVQSRSNTRVTELNLVTNRDGRRQRWHLLSSIYLYRAFDDLLKPLIEETGLPAVRMTDTMFGWEVAQRPYPDG